MRVLLDATAIPADRGGVGRYLDGLAAGLVSVGAVDASVVCQAHDVAEFERIGLPAVAAPAAISRRPVRMAWEQVGLPLLVRRERIDVLHSPHYTMPMLAGVPTVVTLHDATFFSDPHLHTPTKRRFFQTATRVAVRRAAGLVVPSDATRTELVRLVSPRASRALVAPHGVDTSVFRPPHPDEVAKLRAGLGLGDQPFVAFLGTLEPRKNVGNLIRGWVAACDGLTTPPVLVLAGGRGWDDSIETAMASVPSGLRLVRPGYLPLEQLRALMGGADVLAYPALGEGFGLPVLEAMACGAAVLTTRRLSLPEVGGDAVAYTEVDAEAIASALRGLLADPAARRDLSARAMARAAEFTWRRCAEIHCELYESVASA